MFRHAERENSGSPNPPLSVKGHLQAAKLVEDIDLTILPRPTKLLSSPKLRAQQTFQQIQDKLGVDIQIQEDLDERQNSESVDAFRKRVRKFLDTLERQAGVIYFVTHLDWIEEALSIIASDTDLSHNRYQAWLPAQSIEFEIHNGLWIFQVLRYCQTR